jgi:glutamyl-tRNA reductase
LDGVYLYDIDSLQSVAEQSLALRRQQIAAAEAIIAQHVEDFRETLTGRLHGGSRAAEDSSIGETPLRTSEL